MSEERWRCWACRKPIEGFTYQKLSLTEKRKSDYAWAGNCTNVFLCHDCAWKVHTTLAMIQDEAAGTTATGEGEDGR